MSPTTKFKSRVTAWAAKIAVTPARVQIQDMKTKWASCSTGGRVCFSRQLLREADDFQESVIVHELLHLLVPNHGQLFRQLIIAYRPEAENVGRCSAERDAATGRFLPMHSDRLRNKRKEHGSI